MNTELAAKLAAHQRFRWMPGMLARKLPAPGGCDSRFCLRIDKEMIEQFGRPPGWLPDLDDAATVGCLISALARDVSTLRTIMVVRERGKLGWWVETHTGSTLGEAVALALLAEWGEG